MKRVYVRFRGQTISDFLGERGMKKKCISKMYGVVGVSTEFAATPIAAFIVISKV